MPASTPWPAIPSLQDPSSPWQGSPKPDSNPGPYPAAQIEAPPGPCPDHPAPGPGRAPWGWRAVLPGWPAAVWLHPRGCGLGTTSCLLREAAGISRTNRETAAPAPPEARGEASGHVHRHPVLQSQPAGKKQNGCGHMWTEKAATRGPWRCRLPLQGPQEGGLTELG